MKVNIRCSEVVIYDQIIEMTEEEYLEIEHLNGEDTCMGDVEYSILDTLIDKRFVFDIEEQFYDIGINIIKE